MFLKNWMYLDENDGAGNDLGGAADRGDDLQPPPAPATDTAAEDEKLILGEKEQAAEDEQTRDDKGRFAKKEHIPKERFDEAVSKERSAREAAERRAAELEAQIRRVDANEHFEKAEKAIESLESQHSKLLLDGEHEKAAQVMRQIRHAERELTEARVEARSSRATSQAVEEVRMSLTVEKLENEYPELNAKHDLFNEGIMNIVVAEQRRLMQEDRMGPSAALDAAAKAVFKFIRREEAAAGKTGLAAAAKTTDRKAEQVAKNLDTTKKQPPSMRDVGLDSDKAGKNSESQVSNMTADEWSALPESTKAKLRGDYVE